MARDDDRGSDQARRKKRIQAGNARNFARNYREKNKPENSTTGVYDVALRSGPGAPEFPYGPPNGPRNPSRTVNWRSSPTRPTSPPQSERATNRGSSGSSRQSGHGGYSRPNTSKSGGGRNYSSKERGAAQNLARIAQNVLKRGR